MRLVAWKPLVKDTLRGSAVVEMPIGLRIYDVPVFIRPWCGAWAGVPTKRQLADVRHKLGEESGR
jgi:hypothetical protein